MTGISTTAPPPPIARRIIAGSALIVVALALSALVGEQAERLLDMTPAARGVLMAVLVSALVVPGIWWLRTRVDRRPVAEVGLAPTSRDLGAMALGVGFVAVPVLLTLLTSRLFGWATISVDTSSAGLSALGIGLLTVFLLEALPEELVVRGYLYRNLSAVQARWIASAVAVLLFVVLPVVINLVQRYLLGLEVTINGASSIQPGFLVTLLVFGSFQQYLRVLTGTVWTGIGFHMAFVEINRIMGPRESQMIRFEEVVNGGPLQVVVFGSIAVILVALIAWPWIRRRPIGWREVDPEQ